jgi:dipeptidyl aminopeptidase/acylaminoacyl peptidase
MESERDGLEARFQRFVEDQRHELDVLHRQVDDLMFFQRLRDVAEIDVVSFTGPPPRHVPNPTAQGAGNPTVLQAYVFIPRELDRTRPQPLLVHPHGGIHANYASSSANVLRELLDQGYSVIAPEYRGSTGYGRDFYELVDYGGLETEDTFAARQFALERYPFLDPGRVGVIGWSHGGLHALLNIFDHPDAYAAAYTCVPVSDLVARMAYKGERYRDLMQAPYHLGKSPEEDVAEYRRRSPSWQAHRYAGTPLLIHSTTNDEDVNVLEVERLIQALQAAGKSETVRHRIYDDAPGGHRFNRLDTALARESRAEAWRFLAPHLTPDRPIV